MESKISDVIHRAPAWTFLLVPALIILGGVALILSHITFTFPLKYVIIPVFFAAIIFMRMLQLWEYGIEAYHFTLFWFAFLVGPLYGLLFVLLSSVLNMYFAVTLRKHYFIHTLLGPMLQTIDLSFVVIFAGLAGIVARGYFLSNPVWVPLIVCSVSTFIEKFLCNRFAGVDWGRLSSAQVIEMMINYNLFTLYSIPLFEFFAANL